METAESLGFIQYWGASKWLNLAPGKDGELKILISGGCDMRHIFKTCLDAKEGTKLTFYVHEKLKEPFCRQLLLMLILHTVNLNFRERTDLFLDIFGNTLVREKSQSYLDFVIPYLDVFVSDSKKYQTALNKIFDLKELKFKDRDEMVEIIRSWYSSVPFQVDKLRDQRLRYHYKTRYDFRTNVIDWDYQMGLKEYAPIIHFYHYREWRQSGVAFESRFSTYPTPNRTLSSYLPGKKKGTHESCLVRGYWGDIIMSPYLSYGISTDVSPEKEKLFKHMIQKFDNGSEYHIDFDGVYKKQEEAAKKQKKQGEKLEQIEEKEEEDQKEQEEETIPENNPQEVQSDSEYFISPEPLQAFQKLDLRIVPIFEDIDKICSRSKFAGMFDAGYIGFFHSAYLKKPELSKIFKPQAQLFVENAKFLVPLKKDERKNANENLLKAGQDLGFAVEQNVENDDYIIFKKQA